MLLTKSGYDASTSRNRGSNTLKMRQFRSCQTLLKRVAEADSTLPVIEAKMSTLLWRYRSLRQLSKNETRHTDVTHNDTPRIHPNVLPECHIHPIVLPEWCCHWDRVVLRLISDTWRKTLFRRQFRRWRHKTVYHRRPWLHFRQEMWLSRKSAFHYGHRELLP